MSQYDWYPRRRPKQPPPDHGIKVKSAGTTWWGQRWIEALESVLRGDGGRLARGRTYARAGRAHDLAVKGARVTAKVTGSASRPYSVTIELAGLSESVWSAAIARMAEKAQFSAELLAGQMPRDIDEAFGAAGASLFPSRRSELKTSCSCPDSGDPCKHVAATHYVLGAAFDRDPFLLFELRGKTKGQVLEALRAARGASTQASAAPEQEVGKVSLQGLKPETYEAPPTALPTLRFSFEPREATGAVLRQLGTPVGWDGAASPAELLQPVVHAAALRARGLALEEEASSVGGDYLSRNERQ